MITAYVNPNGVGAAAEWVPNTVQYEVPQGHPLIGTEFTWGFTATKPSGTQFFAGFDAASVDFVAVPEPTTIALLGAGVAFLGFRLARRRGVKG